MKTRKPLKRSTPLKRTTIKKKSSSKLAVPKDVYQRVLARDAGCVARGTLPGSCYGRIDPHHVLRKSHGGPDTESNLISLCRLHHSWVHEHPAESYELGYLKHSWEDPNNNGENR